jgi:hypothetical protein
VVARTDIWRPKCVMATQEDIYDYETGRWYVGTDGRPVLVGYY